MTIPVTGIVLVSLGTYWFFFAPRRLYLAAVFLIPFSATAVANVGWGGEQKGISAWIFMAALWIFRTTISPRPFWKQVGWRLTRRARIQLLVLLTCGLVSLLVPLVLNGTVWIEYYRLYSAETIPLRMDSARITQTGYFAFGIVFTMLVAVENCDPRRLWESVRVYVASAMFVSAWGFFQQWCSLTGHRYPAFLFNNSMGTSAQLYIERFSTLDIGRMSSVAVEPSQFAFSMLFPFVMLLVGLGLRRPIFSRVWDAGALLLILAALVCSTATTAYLGLLLGSVLAVVVLTRARALRSLYVVLVAGAAVTGVVLALTVPVIRELVDLIILNKAQGYSGLERMHETALAARYFTQYPILGISWNAVGSGDLVFQVLSSLGIVGFLSLVVFLTHELRILWRAPDRGSRWSLVLFPAVCLMLIISESVGFPFAMGYVWLALGLGVSAPFIVRRTAASLAAGTVSNAPNRDTGVAGGFRAFPPQRPQEL